MLEHVLATIVLFALGTSIGSFLNVVICRSIQGETWIWGRSHCDVCKIPLKWYDLVPIFSFVFLSGKCRVCKTSVSINHLLLELLGGALFVWWYWIGALFFKLSQTPFHVIQPLFWLSIAIVCLAIFFTDLWYLIIPDTMVLALTVMTVLYRAALWQNGIMQTSDVVNSLFITALTTGFLWFLWWITGGRGMGLGDVKLMIPLGLLLGWPKALVGLFIAFVSGAFVGVILIALKQAKTKQPIPFGPFMLAGAAAALVVAQPLLDWYLRLLGF